MRKYLKKRNVIGFSRRLQPRIKDGEEVPGTRVIRFYVTKKEDVPPEHQIPRRVWRWFRQYETDVVEIGEVELLTRPLKPGDSIGHYMITAGTAGAFIYANNKKVILTNNHVAANISFTIGARARIGDPVLAPGRYDGGKITMTDAQDTIGSLMAYVPLDPFNENTVDAALVQPLLRSMLDHDCVGRLCGETTEKQHLYFYGRSSGYKAIQVLDTSAHILVNARVAILEFTDQLLFKPPSIPGDSGSVLRDVNCNLHGLVFAGSREVGFANKMVHVVNEFARLGIELTERRKNEDVRISATASVKSAEIPANTMFPLYISIKANDDALLRVFANLTRDLTIEWLDEKDIIVRKDMEKTITLWLYAKNPGSHLIRWAVVDPEDNDLLQLSDIAINVKPRDTSTR